REHALRDVFNALRYLVKTGCGWRYLPHDLPPWEAVYQQWGRWRDNRCFEHMMADLRELARVLAGREADPTAVILDSRTVQSTPESGARAGYDGAKRRKGSKVHVAVDTLGHLLAAVVTPANEPDRGQVAALCAQVQRVTGQKVQVAYTDQGYTGAAADEAAAEHAIDLQVIAKPEGQKGFVLLPRRWVVERSFGWAA
ncbi:IS5 family transposase, partial [Hymenobacter edaphi]